MISAWWLLILVPAFIIGNRFGYGSGMRTARHGSRMAKKLLKYGNTEGAIVILDIMEGVRTKKENRTFDQRLKELDQSQSHDKQDEDD
jgi:hypothetical protein